MSELAFDVPIHPLMLARVAGKRPNTVLTIERQIYTWRICEYTEPLSYGRHWCYETPGEAVIGLTTYLAVEAATEPQGWKRAIDFGDELHPEGTQPHDHVRVRRAHMEFGERVITEDEPE